MAKKEENTEKAPRLSTIERLQQQLAEAQEKQRERDQKKVNVLREQYVAAVARLEKAQAKVNELAAKLHELENPDTTDGVDVSDGVGEPTESE